VKSKPGNRIGIIGCGKMGRNLFDFFVDFPFHITLVCKTGKAIEEITNTFEKKQKRALKYKLIDQGTFDFRNQNTVITTDHKLLAACDLVIETITEDLNKKRDLFKQLNQTLSMDCVIASDTSSIPPDEIFAGIVNEEKCLGLHFFFPVAMKDIVEVNVAKNTSKKTVSFVTNFLRQIGKFNLVLTKNEHFIINRIFLKMQAGCCQLLQEGKWNVYEIDALVATHLFPIGIFEFFDHVGNDVMLKSVDNYIKYEAAPGFYHTMIEILDQKVKEGKLGKKSNSGFYEYPQSKTTQNFEEKTEMHEALQKITHWYLDGVFDVFNKSICTKNELEHIVKEYMMVEKSPFELAGEFGYTPK